MKWKKVILLIILGLVIINMSYANYNITFNLSGTDTGNWIGTNIIRDILYYNDTNIYLAVGSGKFGVYDSVTNITTDLSSTDTGNWMESDFIDSLEQSSQLIFLGLQISKFGVYNPVTNISSNLSGTDINNWFGTTEVINDMDKFNDSIVFLGLSGGRFGYYDIITNISYDLSSTNTGDWISGSNVQSLVYTNENLIYLGLDSGKFGVYDISSNITSDLSASDTGNWIGTTNILALESLNNTIVFFVADSGKFGYYDSTTNTSYNLSGTDTGNWIGTATGIGLNVFNSEQIFMTFTSGKFGVYNFSNNVTTDLSATDDNNWFGTDTLRVVTSKTEQKFYIGGDSGKFGYYYINSIPIPQNIFVINDTNGVNCSFVYYDNDSNVQSGQFFQWNKNNITQNITSQTFGIGNYTANDELKCSVSVADGYENSSYVNSSLYIVGDTTAPSISAYSLDSNTGYTDEVHTISLTCADTYSIANDYPRVQFIDVASNMVGNLTMSLRTNTTTIYDKTYAFNTLGTYTNFTFFCKDGNGNEQINQTNISFVSSIRPIAGGGNGGGGGRPTACNWKVWRPANRVIKSFGWFGYKTNPISYQIFNNESQAIEFNYHTTGLNCVLTQNKQVIQGNSFGLNQIQCEYPESVDTGVIVIDGGGCSQSIDVQLVSNTFGLLTTYITGGAGVLLTLVIWFSIFMVIIFITKVIQ